MNQKELEEIKLIGLALPWKTTNDMGRSGVDCGNLWQKFEKENCVEKIPNRLTDEVLAVYHQYEGDHTRPFSYFIGCKVDSATEVPEGLDSLVISKGPYEKVVASGKMPDCVANTWKEIWNSGIPRAYQTDFEVYDERSRDWNNAVVDLYVSTTE